MIDVDKANACASELAHWRLQYDLGLAWHATLKRLGPQVMARSGRLLLRRWSGAKFPRPGVPQVVGAAVRPAATVTEKGVTPANGVYWYETWILSGGGLLKRSPATKTRCVPIISSNHPGLIPNAPSCVGVEVVPSDYVAVSWIYDEADEQVAPATFEVCGDGGTGTMDWASVLATVTYRPGCGFYRVKLGPYGVGTRYFNLRAKTSGGVYSLLPESSLGAAGYDSAAWVKASRYGYGVTLESGERETLPAPVF